MKVGVEMEFWVVDGEGRLADCRDLVGDDDRVVPEFVAPLIEIQTPPVGGIDALRDELRDVLDGVLARADECGKELVPLGTPLSAEPIEVISERGELLELIFGERLERAKNCAGTHIHFDKGEVDRQVNLLTALDPALALVGSSPYYRGERLGSSSRAYVYRNREEHEFDFHRDLWEYMTDEAEWNARVRDRYDEIEELAVERGVPSSLFEAHFTPEDAVLTPVRIRSRSPTVEWRSPDTALPSQIVRLTTDVVGILKQAEYKRVEIGDPEVREDAIRIPEFGDLQGIAGKAIADGLGSGAVREYLETMGFDPARYRPISAAIGGPDRIDAGRARRVRLEYAEALREDVRGL